MKQTVMFVFISCAAALTALPAQAQEWPAEQLEVWETISKQWDLARAEDDAWMDQLHPWFFGWVEEAPTPQDKEVTGRFIAAEAGQFKTLVQHIQPVGIAVVGDTAVAYYYSMSLAQYTDDGEQETFDSQHTEVLTKTADGWQFLG
jgi:hypothetical protein